MTDSSEPPDLLVDRLVGLVDALSSVDRAALEALAERDRSYGERPFVAVPSEGER
jgi:hypothetical protein